jgi:leucyl-tRNA synthetase
VQGACERCGAQVTKRELTQWFFKVTDYADRLLDDMEQLRGSWPERVLTMQRNWIGRSQGAHVTFDVAGREVTVFTTRPDTLYGATFFVVAADAPLALELCAPDRQEALEAYRDDVRTLSDIDRQSTDRPEDRRRPGRHGAQPRSPASRSRVRRRLRPGRLRHRRDHGGAGARPARPRLRPRLRPAGAGRRRHRRARPGRDGRRHLPATACWSTAGPTTGCARTRRSSGSSPTWRRAAAAGAPSTTGCATGCCRGSASGAPDPDRALRCLRRGGRCPTTSCPSGCPTCAGRAQAAGTSPLGAATDWVTTTCPSCGGPATRDTDTMDTFVDSSWYYLRYCSPDHQDGPFDPAAVREWMPVAQYVGGVEHAILHLLYSRFFMKVLHDMGMVDAVEPFAALMNQGQVINQGKAMSKSLGNGVDLGRSCRRTASTRCACRSCSPGRRRTTSTGPTSRRPGR